MTPTEILDIIILIYYVPALLTAIYVGLKHGFSRSAGWWQMNLLSLSRLTGSALGIAAVHVPNQGVLAASLVFSSMGTVSLLGALLGLVGRVHQGLGDTAIPQRLPKLVQLGTIAAIVLSIVGGDDAFDSDASTRSEGRTLLKAAVILLVVIFVVAVGISLRTLALQSMVPQCDRRLLQVSLVSIPFILVRLVYALCSVFDYTSSTFSMASTTTVAVIVRALMGVLMEFIVVALFLWAGLTVDRSAERERQRAEKHAAKGSYQSEHGTIQDSRLTMQKLGSESV